MKNGPPLRLWPLICVLLAGSGCDNEPRPLQLADLTADETAYIQQLVVLERAKAVLLVDPQSGHALLDSLSVAWGDSAAAEAQTRVPRDPVRSQAVNDLFVRILTAEADSLLFAPRPARLADPLPDPLPPAPAGEDQPATK